MRDYTETELSAAVDRLAALPDQKPDPRDARIAELAADKRDMMAAIIAIFGADAMRYVTERVIEDRYARS